MKKLMFFGRCLIESLTASTAALICLLLTVPLKEHNGELAYLLPVMLFYACMKTGVFLLHGAVHIENPYRMMKYCIITAFVGSFFLLNGNSSSVWFLIGAVITGTALSPFASLYKSVSVTIKQVPDRPFLRSIVSTVILMAVAVWCLISKKSASCTIFRFWGVYLGLICMYIIFLPGKEQFTTGKVLVLKSKWLVHTLPALLLFVMMAAVSGYKQSGNAPVFILMLVSFVFIVIWSRIFEDRKLFRYSAQTMWLGAVRGFEMLFTLIYIADTQQGRFTYILYAVILGAGFFTPVMSVVFRKFSKEKTMWICMTASLLCLLLVISRNPVLTFTGVFLCVSFTNTAKSANLNDYRNDNRVLQDEYIFRQDKMYSVGNGVMQGLTMIILFLAGMITSRHGSALMKFYVYKDQADGIETTLLTGGIVCVLLLFVTLIAIYKMPEDHRVIEVVKLARKPQNEKDAFDQN